MTARAGTAWVVTAGSALACGLAVHTFVNLKYLRRPQRPATTVDESVTVLIPARDEAAHIGATVQSALAQAGLRDLEVIVLDDGSSDDTAAIVTGLIDEASAAPGTDAGVRLRLVHGGTEPVPAGWLGKPWACARLADQASGSVLAFVDADVLLEPDAVAALVSLLREHEFALVAPYPRQLADGWLERLVQPLVTWSWVATLPLRWAETSSRPSLSAANGQLIVLDAVAYRSVGGHAAVRGDVIEDVALMRALKRRGLRTATVDGSQLATCRMYDGSAAVVAGYSKSLWSAFGGPAGSVGVNALLLTAYVVPAAALVAAPSGRLRAVGAIGYAAGVASRMLVARRTGEPTLPDAFAHPASIVSFTALNVISWWRHTRGRNTWKGRQVVAT